MKASPGLLIGAIVIGLLLIGGASAFVLGLPESVVVTDTGPKGVTEMNAFPQLDALAIEVHWRVLDPEATYVLQRTTDPDAGDWHEVFVLEPGSNADVDADGSAVYVDTDVERLQRYFYRFYYVFPSGGDGYSIRMAVTAT